jgi:hypothetical protein
VKRWEIGNAMERLVLRRLKGLRRRRRRVAGVGFEFAVFGHDCLFSGSWGLGGKNEATHRSGVNSWMGLTDCLFMGMNSRV